jgi:hypothetical protein
MFVGPQYFDRHCPLDDRGSAVRDPSRSAFLAVGLSMIAWMFVPNIVRLAPRPVS